MKGLLFFSKTVLNKYVRQTIGILSVLIVFALFHWVAEGISESHAAGFAFAFTACFITGVFTGWYMSYLCINSRPFIQNGILVVLSALTFAMILLANVIANKIANSGDGDVHYGPSKILLFFIVIFIMSVSIGVVIKLVRGKILEQIRLAEASAAHSRSELQLLQSQISPHFLFNTLNNIYGISISAHEKVPPLLLKLSDLLRYSVYDARKTFVPLKEEIAYLKNYTEFEKIRIGDRLNLVCKLEEITDKNIEIAPMLLIVFVENAFKHAKNTSDQKIYIDIQLTTWSNSLLFSVKNSYKKEGRVAERPGNSSGMGLDNVQKRLQLLYPNGYDLKIEESDGVFSVMLRVNVKIHGQ